MAVHYQTLDAGAESRVLFDTVSRNGDAQTYARQAAGRSRRIPRLPDGRRANRGFALAERSPFRRANRGFALAERSPFRLHRVLLDGLEPGQTYYFIAGDAQTGWTPERKFRTMPDGEEPFRFVEGGDMGATRARRALLEQAAKLEPQFVVLGGDISQDKGKLEHIDRWDGWFADWSSRMVTPSGYSVPVMVALGDNEMNEIDSDELAVRAPLFTAFFGFGSGRPYYARQVGKNAVFFLLDSGLLRPHGGQQADWLAAELENHRDVPVKFAVYHKPLYPSRGSLEGIGATMGRKYWLPLFDKYGLTAGFEHHEHVLARTYRMRAGEKDPNGTLYVGDGCFGEEPRPVHAGRSYFEKAESAAHFWAVDVAPNAVRFRAIAPDGSVLDESTVAIEAKAR